MPADSPTTPSGFQPGMNEMLAEYSRDLYAGFWLSEDGLSNATIIVEKGTLYVVRMSLNSTDIILKFHAPGRLSLRSLERRDEFRRVRREHLSADVPV